MTQFSPLVSTDWLEKHAEDSSVIILESSVFLELSETSGRPEFRSGLDAFEVEGRIPKARFADMFSEFSDPNSALPFTRPDKAHFDAAAGRLGITLDSHVVIYDRLVGQWASRLWWVFRSFGHLKVSVLDGGLKKYVHEGRKLEDGRPYPYPLAQYNAPSDGNFVVSKQDVVQFTGSSVPADIVCFLPEDDFAGKINIRERAGHIPGSANLPFKKLLNPETNGLQSVEKLRQLFSEIISLDGRKVITYCGGGIASTLGALALAVLDYSNTAEYDGSLAEWVLDTTLPMETGLARR